MSMEGCGAGPASPAGRTQQDRTSWRRLGTGFLGGSLLGGCLAAGVPFGVPAAHAEPSPRLGSAPAVVARPARAATAADSAGAVDGTVTISGSGFGHGVGLSQYGALGMARAGASAPEILRHYFTGTTVESYPDAIDLRVNVVDRGSRVTLRTVSLAAGGGAFRLFPGSGTPVDLAEGDVVVVVPVDGGLTVSITRAGDQTATALAVPSLAVRWSGARAMPGPATLLRVDSRSANGSSTSSKSRQYRWGSLSMAPVRRSESGGAVRPRIEANALLSLHNEYLRGLSEVPSSWPDAALAAQVVAARNYALVRAGHPMSSCGGCVLWDDTRSQVYRGWEKESTTSGSRWLAAIEATRTSRTQALAVLYQGAPISAYYSSSTGGRTRDASSVWGSAVPYLRSVDDAWSTDAAINPSFAAWTRSVPTRSVLSAFGLSDLMSVAVTERDAGGAAVTLTATASDGQTATLSGSSFCSRFGLPAQWVTAVQLPAS